MRKAHDAFSSPEASRALTARTSAPRRARQFATHEDAPEHGLDCSRERCALVRLRKVASHPIRVGLIGASPGKGGPGAVLICTISYLIKQTQ
eukprot:364644-Chlamydomonas_euryale.AAC.16